MSDKTQSIQKAHTANVMPTGGNAKGGQLGTIFGIESGDIRIPYVYLVRSGTLSAKLADGSRAPVGSLFHSVKKEAVDKLEVLIAHASKGISREKKKDNLGNVVRDAHGDEVIVEAACYRAIVLPVKTPKQPFMISFKGFNLFSSWKDFISELASTGRTNLDVVVTLGSREQETNFGYTQVFDLKITGAATEEQRELMLEASHSFGSVTQKAVDDEDDVEQEAKTATVDNDLSFLNDKDSVDLDDVLPETSLDDILKS